MSGIQKRENVQEVALCNSVAHDGWATVSLKSSTTNNKQQTTNLLTSEGPQDGFQSACRNCIYTTWYRTWSLLVCVVLHTDGTIIQSSSILILIFQSFKYCLKNICLCPQWVVYLVHVTFQCHDRFFKLFRAGFHLKFKGSQESRALDWVKIWSGLRAASIGKITSKPAHRCLSDT